MLKNEFFEYIISLIDKSKHPVEYKNPDFTILLEISNDLLCFTVAEKYYQYRLYNLLALCKSDEEIKLERDRLMHLQNTVHERKNFDFKEDKNEINKYDSTKEKIENENVDTNNLSLNEDDDIKKNYESNENSDVDLI